MRGRLKLATENAAARQSRKARRVICSAPVPQLYDSPVTRKLPLTA